MQAPPPAKAGSQATVSTMPSSYDSNEANSSTTVASAFPQELPARTAPPPAVKEPRNTHWYKIHPSSFNACGRNLTGKARWRRIMVCLTLFCGFIDAVLAALSAGFFTVYYGGRKWNHDIGAVLIIYCLVAPVALYIEACCLCTIERTEGRKRAFALNVGRRGFDIFLHVVCFCEAVLAGCWIIVLIIYAGVALELSWLFLVALTFYMSWCASKPAPAAWPAVGNDV